MAHELGGLPGSRVQGAPLAFVERIKASLRLFGLLLVASAGAANAAVAPPMTTPGQFNVSATGAATYSVPIAMPPGTAGMAPSLSLNYSSQSGNGIVGFGWSLGGLPAVTRCPQTYAQDGTHGGVNYNSSDRFCLDGQRLLVINGGTYGADLSEYRTEIESFSRVIAHTTAGNLPDWFEVHTKSGQIIELGNSANSRILAQGTSVARVWAASKISDTVGNYMQVFYTTNQGQYYPNHIVYTGNTTASVSPYNSVFFYYTPRSDPSTLYHAGSMISTAQLLSDIKTYTNPTGTGTAVTDYRLTYTLGNAPFSQLTSVQRCDGSGACLASTSFAWQTASTWPTRIEVDSMPTLPATFLGSTSLGADFNGDGLPDGDVENGNCVFNGGLAQPLFAVAGNGFVASNMTITPYGGSPMPGCVNAQPQSIGQFGPSPFVDFNGDGFADINSISLSGISVFFNNGAGSFVGVPFFYPLPWEDSPTGLSQYGDYNGDGRTDWFDGNGMTGGVYHFQYSNGDGSFSPDAGGHSFGSTSNPAFGLAIGDIDGDGCTDLIVQGGTTEILLSCQPAVATIPAANYTNNARLYPGDFNGDGNGDFVAIPYTGANATLNISTGTSFVQSSISGLVCGLPPSCGPTYGIYTGDFDGDGKTDVAMVLPHYLKVFTWQGTALTLVLTVNIDLPQPNCNGFCPTGFNGTLQTADVDGDGCTDLAVSQDGSHPFWYMKFGCHPPLLMTSVSNGVGATTTISYDRLNRNQPLYTKCPSNPSSYACGDTYPIQGVDGPIYVVAQVDTSNGTAVCVPHVPPPSSNCFTTTYAYAGAKNDLSGRGFLGYQQVTATDLQTNVVRTTNYNTLFPLTGTALEQKRTLGGVVLSDTVSSYTTVPAIPVMGTPTFVYEAASTVTGHEIDGTALPSSTTLNSTPDGYGNIQTVSVTVSDGSSKLTQNHYSNDPSLWLLGRLVSTTVTSTVGTSAITRTSTFHYNAANGVLDQEIIEPIATGCQGNATSCNLETDYTLDAFGHRHVAVVSGSGFASRTTTVFYSANGALATSTMNNLGQSDATDYSGPGGAEFGTPTSHTDINTLQTSWSSDTLGRETLETRPGYTGTKTAVSYQYCAGVNGGTSSCPTNGAYLVQTTPTASNGTTQNGPATKTYYDMLGRAIAVDVEGFDGPASGCTLAAPCWIRTSTQYDANGNVGQTSRPYLLAGGTPKWTSYVYDALGRPTLVTAPDGGTTTYAYTGLGNAGSQASVTNALLTETTLTRKNAQGLVSSMTNALNKTTSYVYDAYGDVLTVTDPVGNQIVNTYDLRGNKLSSSDPDLGLWTYSYDALGELLTQTDPNERAASAITTLSYDGLGRLHQRNEPDQTSAWTYDTATHGAGLLASATGSNAGYSRAHTYDSLSRPAKVTLTINAKAYAYNRSYDSNGRIATLSYPSGLVVQYVYTSLGYLSQLKDNATGAVLWTANARDAEMHLTDQLAGNGVDTLQVFDPNTGLVQQIRASADGLDDGSTANFSTQFDRIGNLKNRSDNYGSTENFCYDKLNRLINYAAGGATCLLGATGLVKSVAYDDTGNITLKSDLADTSGGTGAYTYANPGNPLPHAVKSISGTANGVKDPGFRYDANGNLTCEYTGPNCSHGAITKETDAYWSFNMAHTIAEGATSLTLTYDSEHARVTQALTTASTTTTTTYLNDPINGAMGEKVATAGTNTWNDYLMADGRLVGERTCTAPTPTCASGATWQYFVLDHLGSVAVLTDGTPGSPTLGQVTARESFDAWGKQRNEDGTDDTTCSNGLTSPTTKGFTSQEEIAAFCLVNLNARIYDPTIARFMAADTMISDAYDGQSYNRYTYTDNRPLSFTDTTGHDPNCIGVCGSNWNPGSQADGNVDQSAHPEMEVLGSFAISESGNLADGVTAIHITYNVSGESAMAQDPTKGEVAISGTGSVNQNAPNSNSNYKATADAAAAQNVQAGAVSAVGAEPATAPEVTSRSVEMAPADRISALVAEVASQGGMPASDTPDTDMSGKTVPLKQYLMHDGRVIKLTAEYFASLGQSNGTSGQYRYFDDRASMNTFLNAPSANGNTNFQGGWSERFGNSNEAGLVTWMYGGAANPGWSGSHNLNYHFDGSNHTVAVDAAKMVQITYSHEYSHIYLHYPPTTIGEEQANKYGLQKAGVYP